MESRRRWATGVVVLVAIAAGAGGGAYLWKEAFPADSDVAHGDGGLLRDASAAARAGRRKSKSAKKSTRPAKRRAAPNDDGQEDDGDEAIEEFRPPFRGRGPAGPTYESAIASNKQELAIGGKAEPDLTDAELAGPMRNGAFVGECGAPDSMKVTVRSSWAALLA
jgi:hypothetical protein